VPQMSEKSIINYEQWNVIVRILIVNYYT